MTSFEAIIIRFLERVELRPADERTFFGRYRGYPMALTLVGDADTPNLLVQLRHLLDKDQLPDEQTIHYADALSALLKNRQAKIELDERIAWVSLYDAVNLEDARTVLDLLDSAVDGLERAGVTSTGNVCHYCERNEVAEVTYADGRVAQICHMCRSDRATAQEEATRATVLGASSTILTGGIACLLGAVLWAAGWSVYNALVAWLAGDNNEVVIPDIVAFAIAAAIGALCGAPIGFLIGKIPRRGEQVGISVAALSAIIAVLVGELLCVVIIVYRLADVLSLSAAWHLLGDYWSGLQVMDILDRVLGLAAAIFVAHLGAKFKHKAPSL